MTSGAIQHGVPTNVFLTLFRVTSPPVAKNALTPKSGKKKKNQRCFMFCMAYKFWSPSHLSLRGLRMLTNSCKHACSWNKPGFSCHLPSAIIYTAEVLLGVMGQPVPHTCFLLKMYQKSLLFLKIQYHWKHKHISKALNIKYLGFHLSFFSVNH